MKRVFDVGPDKASILMYIGRTISRSADSFLANMADPKIHNRPPILRVFGAPILLAAPPTNRLSNGAMPRIAIV